MRKKFTAKAPRFRAGEPQRSAYYWWWEYLRRNDDYLRCCADNGQGPIADLYKDFGDVRSDDFKSWWRRTGENLFCEPPMQTLHIIEQRPDYVTVFVPLTMNKGSIRRRFKWLLDKVHTRKKGGRVFDHSRARYPLATKPVPEALQMTLRVYDLWKKHGKRKGTRKKHRREGWSLWMIGEAADASPALRPKPTDIQKDLDLNRTQMATVVRRYIVAAERYIKNVGKGRFPVK